MNGLKLILWFLEYHLVPVRFVSNKPPNVNSVVLDMAAQKYTSGRFGFGYAHMAPRECSHCGDTFYSKEPRDICLKWECYLAKKEGKV